MPNMHYSVVNQIFADDAFKQDGHQKVAEALSGPLRTHVREGCLMNQVWPMVTPEANKIQRDLTDPTQVYVYDDMEPDWVAVAMNADGMPTGHFYAAEAFATKFYPIRSKEEEITEDRLRHLTYSVEDYFKKHIGNEIARVRDAQFVALLTATAAGTGFQYSVASGMPTAKDILSTIDLIDANTSAEIFGTDLICHYSFLNKILKGGVDQFDMGAWEVFKDGYQRGTMLGRRLHLTRKKEFPVNKMFVVAPKEYVATNYEDYALKFQAERDLDVIKMKAKASMGHGIYNAYGVAELTWTSS